MRQIWLAVLLALATLAGCQAPYKPSESTMSELQSADALAQAVVKARGVKPASLAQSGVVSYGTLQFEFDDRNARLVVSILTAEDELWNQLGAKFEQNYLKSKAALNDPKIGGMFDAGGGTWRFEPDSGRTYLFKAYDLHAPVAVIDADIDAMSRVVPAWSTRWSGAVAEIAQGLAPPPATKVTLESDPYADRF